MSHLEECSIEVAKALGRELTSDEKKLLGDEIESLIEKFDKEGQGGAHELNAKVLKAIEQKNQDLEIAALIEKRNAALNAKAVIQTQNYLLNVWGNNPTEGVKAVFENSVLARQGSRYGVARHVDAKAAYYSSGLASKLAEKNLLKEAASGHFDEAIFKAIHEMDKEIPNPEVMKSFPKEVVEIAKLFKDMNEVLRRDANQAGAWIKHYPGYVIKRSHDPIKIKSKGFEAWKTYLAEHLDWEKTLPDVPSSKRDKVLRELFEQHANGVHVVFGEGGVTGLTGFSNIGKSLSHERIYHFKTPEAEYGYFKEFGIDGSLLDRMHTGAMRMGRDIAIMEKLGPNARANFEKAVENVKEEYIKSERGEKASELDKAFTSLMKKSWPLLTGESSIPHRDGFAKWSGFLRNVQTMRDLSRVVISAIPDIGLAWGGTMNHIGERNFKAYVGEVFQGAKTMIGAIGHKITPEQMKMASEAGVLMDAMNPIAYVSPDIDTPGRSSNWLKKFFKMNLMSFWQDNIKLGAVNATSHRHALHAELPFDKLPRGLQAYFNQFDIQPHHWEVMRKGEIFTDQEGRKFLSPESISELPLSSFDSLPEVKLKKQQGKLNETRLDRVREQARKDLTDKYRALFNDVAAMVGTEPGKIERSIMLQGTQSGTALGEALRHFWMYKSFTVTSMRRHMGRELYGYGSESLPLHKAFMAMVKNKDNGALSNLTGMILFGTTLGMTSNALRDITKGIKPRVPDDAESLGKIMMAGALQSGSFGIYGDFLFGEMKSRFGQAPLDTFLGPTFRTINDVADLWIRFKEGDKVAAKAFNFALNNTPGVNGLYNNFYTRWALDYGLVYNLQEMLNPGYLQRMENRLKKEKDQEFIVPPSKVIKPGGGFR